MNRQEGFTLLEVVLAITIMSMIVATLYMALSQASRTWESQDRETDEAKRLAIVTDLLSLEFESLRPYNFLHEKGGGNFYAVSPSAMFYATTQGFGAQRRARGRLYFACLFLAAPDSVPPEILPWDEDEERSEGLALFLCKSDRPAPWLLEELIAFRDMDEASREAYLPGLDMLERSVYLLGGLQEARFSASAKTELPDAQNATEAYEDLLPVPEETAGFSLEDLDLVEVLWKSSWVPALTQLSMQFEEGGVVLVQGKPEQEPEPQAAQ